MSATLGSGRPAGKAPEQRRGMDETSGDQAGAVDLRRLLAAETAALTGLLDELDEAGWNTPSLCAGWRVREVVVHLLMPYELSLPRFLLRMATARFSFD